MFSCSRKEIEKYVNESSFIGNLAVSIMLRYKKMELCRKDNFVAKTISNFMYERKKIICSTTHSGSHGSDFLITVQRLVDVVNKYR